MSSPHPTPRLSFWIATTLALIITTFPLIFLGAFSGSAGERWRNLGLLMILSSFVALLQALLLISRSLTARVQWFCLTLVGTAIGWGTVLALSPLLGQMTGSSTISNQLILGAFDGFITGSPMGIIVGLVTGIIQGRIQLLSARQLLVGNLMSWSIGIGLPFALLFAAFSQVGLF
jgi:hypothetical protein